MELPTIHLLTKNGNHSKGFDSRATQLTRDLYAKQLGGELVTKKVVRTNNIRHVLWIESDDGKPVAATMVIQLQGVYHRVGGLAVDDEHKRKGYGSALLRRIHELLPSGSRLILGVDKGKDATDWLIKWYTRMGFVRVSESRDEVVLGRAIVKRPLQTVHRQPARLQHGPQS